MLDIQQLIKSEEEKEDKEHTHTSASKTGEI